MKPSITTILAVLSAVPTAWTSPTSESEYAPVQKRDPLTLWSSLPRDLSGRGVTHLTADGVLQTLDAKREVLGEVKLTRDEVAALSSSVQKKRESVGTSTPRSRSLRKAMLEARACIDYACDEDEDCNAECHYGCWYVDPPGAYRCFDG